MTSNELRAIRATRDHVLTAVPPVAHATRQPQDFLMLYLKNTLGGLGRSLTDSALNSFQGPHRWWKLALFAVLVVVPGGSVGVVVMAWAEARRARKSKSDKAGPDTARTHASARATSLAPASTVTPAAVCQARGDAPCRAAAGKQARQATSTETRG
jgi:hypothetical protein